MKDYEQRPMKEKSITEIEAALSSALSALFGSQYTVKINSIDFNKDLSAWVNDASHINMVVSKRMDHASLFGKNEESA